MKTEPCQVDGQATRSPASSDESLNRRLLESSSPSQALPGGKFLLSLVVLFKFFYLLDFFLYNVRFYCATLAALRFDTLPLCTCPSVRAVWFDAVPATSRSGSDPDNASLQSPLEPGDRPIGGGAKRTFDLVARQALPIAATRAHGAREGRERTQQLGRLWPGGCRLIRNAPVASDVIGSAGSTE